MKLVLLTLVLFVSLVAAESGSYAYYCYFLSDPQLTSCYWDGFVSQGPFRANGPVVLLSSTPGRDNDPWFYSFTLSSDYYVYGFGSPGIHCTSPQFGDLWIEPYEFMQQGSPWFVLGAEPLPFGADNVDWQTIRDEGMSNGLFLNLPDGARIILRDSVLSVMETAFGNETVYQLSELNSPAVWINNSPTDRVHIRGNEDSPFTEQLTIGGYGDFYLSGELLSEGDGMVGIVSISGDLVIADEPEYPAPGWTGYEIETAESFTFQCSMMALEGEFSAENVYHPLIQAVFTLAGGMQICQEGYTGTPNSGFDLDFSYDERLLTESPPFYPEYELSGNHNSSRAIVEQSLTAAPNPFSSSVEIVLPYQGKIRLYDQSGRLAAESQFCNGWVFDGSSFPAGVYIASVTSVSGDMDFIRLVKID
jgi:hypothetical protein